MYSPRINERRFILRNMNNGLSYWNLIFSASQTCRPGINLMKHNPSLIKFQFCSVAGRHDESIFKKLMQERHHLSRAQDAMFRTVHTSWRENFLVKLEFALTNRIETMRSAWVFDLYSSREHCSKFPPFYWCDTKGSYISNTPFRIIGNPAQSVSAMFQEVSGLVTSIRTITNFPNFPRPMMSCEHCTTLLSNLFR